MDRRNFITLATATGPLTLLAHEESEEPKGLQKPGVTVREVDLTRPCQHYAMDIVLGDLFAGALGCQVCARWSCGHLNTRGIHLVFRDRRQNLKTYENMEVVRTVVAGLHPFLAESPDAGINLGVTTCEALDCFADEESRAQYIVHTARELSKPHPGIEGIYTIHEPGVQMGLIGV